MHTGQLVFAQVMAYLPLKAFSRMVAARRAQHKVQDFSCLDQFLVLAFAQLTTRESLRDIEINLRAQRKYALRQRTIELGVGVADGCDRLRVGFDYDRLVFGHLQLGTVSNYEGSDQASYPDRFEGIDPEFYSYQRWKNARCKSARYPLRARLYRGWRVLRDGQSVCRLRATLHIAHGQSVLRDSCQDKHASRDGAIVSRRDKYWFDQRSSCSIGWGADRCAVSRANSTCNVLRPRNRQYLRVSDKQSHPASQHYLRTLQTALASRIVLQMDQTAPSNQSLLWQHGKCREDANMDRDCDLRLDCNYEEAIEFETFALRNPKSIGLKHV